MKKILLINLLYFFSSCAMLVPNESGSYKKSTAIQNNLLERIPSPWIAINNDSADFALTNKNSGSVFLLNSACRKFEGSDLNSLTSSILVGVEVISTLEKKIINYQHRDAIDMTVLGKVDGIERYFHLITTQKNNCIYDFVLISVSEKKLDIDNLDFLNFIQRIEIH